MLDPILLNSILDKHQTERVPGQQGSEELRYCRHVRVFVSLEFF